MQHEDFIKYLNDTYALKSDIYYNNWYCRICKESLDNEDKVVFKEFRKGARPKKYYLVKILKARCEEIGGDNRLHVTIETPKGVKDFSSNGGQYGGLKFVLCDKNDVSLFPLYFFYHE